MVHHWEVAVFELESETKPEFSRYTFLKLVEDGVEVAKLIAFEHLIFYVVLINRDNYKLISKV